MTNLEIELETLLNKHGIASAIVKWARVSQMTYTYSTYFTALHALFERPGHIQRESKIIKFFSRRHNLLMYAIVVTAEPVDVLQYTLGIVNID